MSDEKSPQKPKIVGDHSRIIADSNVERILDSKEASATIGKAGSAGIKTPSDVKKIASKVKSAVQQSTIATSKKQSLRPHSGTKILPKAKTQSSTGTKKLIKPVTKTKVRKTTLQVSKIRPFTVFRMMLLLGMALAIVLVVASLMLWFFMNATGAIDSINKLIRETMSQQEQGFDIRGWLNPASLSGVTLVVGIVSSVLLAAIAALGAMIYNIAVRIVGGFEITLTDES